MRYRLQSSIRIAAVVVTALLTAACGDSGSPTEPLLAPTPTPESLAIAGGWTGTYSGVSYTCEASADANFNENRGNLAGIIHVSAPCRNEFLFRGEFYGITFEGEFTDSDGLHIPGRGTVSGNTLQIYLDTGWLGSSRMDFHR